MNYSLKILVFTLFSVFTYAQESIRGIVVEKDSNTVMPYVYIINKTNGNGAMSNLEGKFFLIAEMKDTLICSYVGYARQFIPVNTLRKNTKGEYVIIMKTQFINLNTITVTAFKYKPYERDYMNKIIDESKIRTIDVFQSPISAAYMQFSRRGKEIRKLAKIFNDILIEEEIQKKYNPTIIRNLTGDQNLDFDNFRKYCLEVNNQFILTHDGFDLYSRVMDCYKRYKSEGR